MAAHEGSATPPHLSPLSVRARTAYGKWFLDPMDGAAQALADAIGCATVTPHALRCARRMGFRVVEVNGRDDVLRWLLAA